MKISYNWLQEYIEEKLPAPRELAEKIIFHAFEVEDIEEKGSDTVMEIKVLPDRAGDCLSHAGIAREIAGLLKFSFKERSVPSLPETPAFPVEVQSDLCRRYIAVRIDGISVGASPEWLKVKLESLGQRSINNIVDATNYVLFDSGQPIHAFDAAKVDGGIVVRLAKEGETIKLLGREEKTLKETDLVISDYLGALAIAGVKGGTSAEVSGDTTSIVIEVANFDSVAVRKTSRRLGLITDASKRFENGFSSEFGRVAADQVAALILELAGGTVSAVTDVCPTPFSQRTISFSLSDIARLLGNSITAADITSVLNRYHYDYTVDGEQYIFTVPHWRRDIMGVHDIAEEVGRVVGYERIPASTLPFTPTIEQNIVDQQVAAARMWAVAHGFREVYTYAFRPKGEVVVSYGAKGKDKLRGNLSDGLKESYELNRLNAPLLGLAEVKLFEIGTVFFADREEVHVALCDKGTIQELSLADFLKENTIDVGREKLSLESLVTPAPFRPWSPYPFIVRDIAVWVDSNEAKAAVIRVVEEFGKARYLQPPQLFDEFSKDGRISVAYRFIFQATNRTLTDEEVSGQIAQLLDTIKEINGAEIR